MADQATASPAKGPQLRTVATADDFKPAQLAFGLGHFQFDLAGYVRAIGSPKTDERTGEVTRYCEFFCADGKYNVRLDEAVAALLSVGDFVVARAEVAQFKDSMYPRNWKIIQHAKI